MPCNSGAAPSPSPGHPTRPTTSTNGVSGPGPRSRRPGRRHPHLCTDTGSRDTGVLGAHPIHPPRGRPGRGRYHLARRADRLPRNPGRLRTNHPPGQRDHHAAPGQTGEDPEGGRDHTGPNHHCQDGQGGAEDRRNEAGTGPGPAGLPPPFDTSSPKGALYDDGPSLLMVGANSANFANFWGDHPGKLAKLANFRTEG